MDCSPPGSSVHATLQARILERVTISFSRGSSRPRDWTHISCTAGRFFSTEPPESPIFTLFSFYSWGCSIGGWAPSRCSTDSFFINFKNVCIETITEVTNLVQRVLCTPYLVRFTHDISQISSMYISVSIDIKTRKLLSACLQQCIPGHVTSTPLIFNFLFIKIMLIMNLSIGQQELK